MPTIHTREEMYELVWTVPMRTLAKGFGISDVALRKRCVRAAVPVWRPRHGPVSRRLLEALVISRSQRADAVIIARRLCSAKPLSCSPSVWRLVERFGSPATSLMDFATLNGRLTGSRARAGNGTAIEMTAMLKQDPNSARLERVASPSSFRIQAGDLTHFIRIIGEGFWTPAEIDDHFDELGDLIARMRQVRTDVRILVDLRESGAQSPETIVRISARIAAAYRDGDRIAMVLSSSLAKLQMKRAIQNLQHEMFVSPKAAEQWLMAYN